MGVVVLVDVEVEVGWLVVGSGAVVGGCEEVEDMVGGVGWEVMVEDEGLGRLARGERAGEGAGWVWGVVWGFGGGVRGRVGMRLMGRGDV